MELPLQQIIESIIFISEKPVKAAFLLDTLSKGARTDEEETVEKPDETGAVGIPGLTLEAVEEALEALIAKYSDDSFAFTIRKVAQGYQFYTKESYFPYVRKAAIHRNQKRLTRSALETLSIIAYRQPITKAEVEFIRGVNCDYAVQKLLEKQLIAITGRSDGPGRPLLYGSSEFFMEYFGINDVSDLPKLKEFADTAEHHLELFRQHQEEQAENVPRTTSEDETEKEDSEALLGTEGATSGGARNDAEA